MSRGVPAEVNLTACVCPPIYSSCICSTLAMRQLTLTAFSWILICVWICKLVCSRVMASFTYSCCSLFLESCVAKSVHTKFQLGQGYTKKHGTSKRERAVRQSGTTSWTCHYYMYTVLCWIFEEHRGLTSNLEKYAPQIFGIVVYFRY